MSTFKATVESVSQVLSHSNADRLEIIKLDGMLGQCCATKGKFHSGDKVVYFPIDSLFIPKLIEFFGIGNFLAGKAKNRLKTVRLRGETSQGFVCSVADIVRYLEKEVVLDVGTDVTELLEITKYEPPEIPCHTGNLVRHPPGIVTYDIEGPSRLPKVVDLLMPMRVYIPEKIEGSNHYSVLNNDGFVVGQKKHQIQPIEGTSHDWWTTAVRYKHEEKLHELRKHLGAEMVSLRSEMCGPSIQKNIYGFKEYTLFTFDIFADGAYLKPALFLEMCAKFEIVHPPTVAYDVILSDFLAGKTIEEVSHGQSLIVHEMFQNLREGLVFKPMEEQKTDLIGGNHRLVLKQRDPIYLDVTGF